MRAHHARQFVITEFHAHYALPAANKGIGFGIAKLLAEQGLTTVVAARMVSMFCLLAMINFENMASCNVFCSWCRGTRQKGRA